MRGALRRSRASRAAGGQSQNGSRFSSQRRATFEDEPVYHLFRVIASFPDPEIRQGLARCGFTSPLFIGTTAAALSNKGYGGSSGDGYRYSSRVVQPAFHLG